MPEHSLDQTRLATPGPGEYDPNVSVVKETAPAPKFGRNKRDFLTISTAGAVPGPGSYNAAP
jgi:Sperm-tail PG-rich repeat